MKDDYQTKSKKFIKVSSLATVGVVAGGIFYISCIEKIKPGMVGVESSPSKGVLTEKLNTGWHFVSPFNDVYKYSVAVEQLYMSADKKQGSKDDESFDIQCSDGKLNVDFEMSYSFDAEKITEVAKRFRGQDGKDIIDNVIKGKLKSYVNEVSNKFTVMEVHLESRAKINAEIQKHLTEKLKDYGIIVHSSNIMQSRPDAKVEKAINERQEAAQQLAKRELQLKNKEVELEETKRQAEINKTKAEAEAEVKRIKAEAEAEAMKQMNQDLTDAQIKKLWIDKWNGQLPTTTGADTILGNIK